VTRESFSQTAVSVSTADKHLSSTIRESLSRRCSSSKTNSPTAPNAAETPIQNRHRASIVQIIVSPRIQ